MKAAKPTLDKVTEFVGTVISFRAGKVGENEHPVYGTSAFVEGDLIDQDGNYHENVRLFQRGLVKQTRDEIGEWVGGKLSTIPTGSGEMYLLDGEAVTKKIATKFESWEKEAPAFNDTDAAF